GGMLARLIPPRFVRSEDEPGAGFIDVIPRVAARAPPVASHGGAAQTPEEEHAMKAAATAVVALAFGLGGTVALAQGAPRPEARLTGPVTGDPEKDTVAYLPTEAGGTGGTPCRSALRFTAEAAPVGTRTGDPEKDTVAYLPAETGCVDMAGSNGPQWR
ncbi:MAG TPA: hypothetical protein VE650_15170, partial [Acetobacteraceae bacterium]|nr:hypothetical protein [Acetobacteraceae bacterium]